MRESSSLKTVLVLSLGGTLFAGYLSAVKLFTKTCAFKEPCPYFLGYPACWYGFGMFLAMFLVALSALPRLLNARTAIKTEAVISFLGILFAGSFVVQEARNWFAGSAPRYGLGLPTCAYGLIFYAAIFALSLAAMKSGGREKTGA